MGNIARSIDACLLRPPPPQSLWTVADVPAEDALRLQAEVRDSPLPDGYYFDGVNYIDVDGQVSKDHPTLLEHLSAFVALHNVEIDAKNAVLQEASASGFFAIEGVICVKT